jgi:hypothetical protein
MVFMVDLKEGQEWLQAPPGKGYPIIKLMYKKRTKKVGEKELTNRNKFGMDFSNGN